MRMIPGTALPCDCDSFPSVSEPWGGQTSNSSDVH